MKNGLVEFKYGEYQHFYYKGRNAVDANNQNRQGYLSLEAISGLKSWEHRMFMYVIATAETNALLAYNYFVRERAGLQKMSKAEFRRALAEKLVQNTLIAEDLREEPAVASPDRENEHVHELRMVPKHRGRYKNGEFPSVATAYVKWPCYLCNRNVRTYCACDKSRIVCSRCWHVHIKL